MFELAKGLKNHNLTFVTDIDAQPYINVESHLNISSLRLIYLNDSRNTLFNDREKIEIFKYLTDHSMLDSIVHFKSDLSKTVALSMNKTVHLVMEEQFDVIIGTQLTKGIHNLCNDANTSCVIQIAEKDTNIFDMNLPDNLSLLSKTQLSTFKYRLYNAAFTIRTIPSIFIKLFTIYSTIIKELPQILGSYYEIFTLKNFLTAKSKYKPRSLQNHTHRKYR
ncbi:hypothetical protein I4U23_021592 [Adineta vaga]|nr:hypothetical protein I4U23_021592 [Adineta vaga]